MEQVLTCPNCGATAEIGGGIDSGSFVCSKCKSTIGFGPGATVVLSKTEVEDRLLGQTLAGYEVKELLGAGGMGRVYLARQVSIDRPVALKVLASRLAENENFTKRFIREAQAAGRLLHPNLVTVFDAGQEGNTYFFSMEYVKGESLSKMIFENGKIPTVEALRIVRQVAEALQYAFNHGIIHRDIKPDNIIISQGGRAKLADLGLAKQIEGEGGESGLTVAGSVMGTPHYLAPEQARNSKDVDQRADIYSLGCTLYNMLTGSVPFSGSSTYEILRKHETDEPVFPNDCQVAEPVCALVVRMMAKAPEDRPQTPGEVIGAIDEMFGTPSTGLIGAGSGSIGSMPTQAAGAGGGMRTPTPAGPTSPISVGSVPGTEPMVKPRKKKLKTILIVAAIIALLFAITSSRNKNQVSAQKYREAERYAKEHEEDKEGIVQRYRNIARNYPDTKEGKRAGNALVFYEAELYAGNNPGDQEGILKKYKEVATNLEGTEWASRAKEAILDIAIKRVEESQLEGPGDLDKLLEQLKAIQEAATDEKFAQDLGKKMEWLLKAQGQGVELERRRFMEEMQKLYREGKFNEVLSKIEVIPEEKAIKIVTSNFRKEAAAKAEIAKLAKEYYSAALSKDWEKASKFVDPRQLDDEKKKKGFQLGVNLLGQPRVQNYRITEIELDLPKNAAFIRGRLMFTRRMPGGRFENKDIPLENHCIRYKGKWYINLEKRDIQKPEINDKEPRKPPRRSRRPAGK